MYYSQEYGNTAQEQAQADMLRAKLASVEEAQTAKMTAGIKPPVDTRSEGTVLDYLGKGAGNIAEIFGSVGTGIRDNVAPNLLRVPGGLTYGAGELLDKLAETLPGEEANSNAANFLRNSLTNTANTFKHTGTSLVDKVQPIYDMANQLVSAVDNNPIAKEAVAVVANPVNQLLQFVENAGKGAKDLLTNEHVQYRAASNLADTYDEAVAAQGETGVGASLSAIGNTILNNPLDALKFGVEATPSIAGAVLAPVTMATGLVGQSIAENTKALENQISVGSDGIHRVVIRPLSDDLVGPRTNHEVTPLERSRSVVASTAQGVISMYGDRLAGQGIAQGLARNKLIGGALGVSQAGAGEYLAEKLSNQLGSYAKDLSPLTEVEKRESELAGLQGALGGSTVRGTMEAAGLVNTGAEKAVGALQEAQQTRLNTKALNANDLVARTTAFTKNTELAELTSHDVSKFGTVNYPNVGDEYVGKYNPIEEAGVLGTDWENFVKGAIHGDAVEGTKRTLKETVDGFGKILGAYTGVYEDVKALNTTIQNSSTASTTQKKEMQNYTDFLAKDLKEKSAAKPQVIKQYLDEIVAAHINAEEIASPDIVEAAIASTIDAVKETEITDTTDTRELVAIRKLTVPTGDPQTIVANTDTAIQASIDAVNSAKAEDSTLGANAWSRNTTGKDMATVDTEIHYGPLGLKSYYAKQAAVASAANDLAGLEKLDKQLNNWIAAQDKKIAKADAENLDITEGNNTAKFMQEIAVTTRNAMTAMKTELATRMDALANPKVAIAKPTATTPTAASTVAPTVATTSTKTVTSKNAPVTPTATATTAQPVQQSLDFEATNSTPVKVTVPNVTPVKTGGKKTRKARKTAAMVAKAAQAELPITTTATTTKVTAPAVVAPKPVTAEVKAEAKPVEVKAEAPVIEALPEVNPEITEDTSQNIELQVADTFYNTTRGSSRVKTKEDTVEDIDGEEVTTSKTPSILKVKRGKRTIAGTSVETVTTNTSTVMRTVEALHKAITSKFPNATEAASKHLHALHKEGKGLIHRALSDGKALAVSGKKVMYAKTFSPDAKFVNENPILAKFMVRATYKDVNGKPKDVLSLEPTLTAHIIAAALDYALTQIKHNAPDMTTIEVADALGISRIENEEALQQLTDMINKIGMPTSAVVMNLGKNIARMSGYTFTEESYVEDEEAFHAALGTMALHYLQDKGIIKYSTVKRGQYNALKRAVSGKDGTVNQKDTATVHFFKYTGNADVLHDTLDPLRDSPDTLKAFSVENRQKVISTSPAMSLDAEGKQGVKPNGHHAANVARLNAMPFTFNAPLMQLLNNNPLAGLNVLMQGIVGNDNITFDSLDSKQIKANIQVYANKHVQFMQRMSVVAEIQGEVNNILRLIALGERYGDQITSEQFYSPHSIDMQHRFSPRNTDIDPQGSKVHRMFFVPSAAVRTVKNVLTDTNFQIQLATSLGLIDEKTTDIQKTQHALDIRRAIPKLRAVLSTEIRSKLDDLVEGVTNKNGASLFKEVSAALNKAGVHNAKVTDLGALMDIANAIRQTQITRPAPFKSYALTEVDGKSNGVALGLLMMPVTANITLLLRKVGIYVNSTYGSFSDWAAARKTHGEYDIYETNAVNSAAHLEASTTLEERKSIVAILGDVLVDETGTVAKLARELNKNPLMVFAYSAGDKSIVRSIIKNLQEQILPARILKLAQAEDQTEFNALAKAIKEVTGATLTKKDAVHFKFTGTQLAAITKAVFAPVAESTTQGVIDTMQNQAAAAGLLNKSFSAQFKIYEAAKKHFLSEMGTAEDRLTLKEAKELQKNLRPFIPSFKGAFTWTKNVSEGVPVFDMEVSGTRNKATIKYKYADTAYASINDILSDVIQGVNNTHDTKNITIERKHLADPGVAGGVLMIQAIDAYIMGFNDKKLNYAGLRVHDAYKTNVENAAAASTLLNSRVIDVIENYSLVEDAHNSLAHKQKLLNKLVPGTKAVVTADLAMTDLQELSAVISAAQQTMYTDALVMDQYPTSAGAGAVKQKVKPRVPKFAGDVDIHTLHVEQNLTSIADGFGVSLTFDNTLDTLAKTRTDRVTGSRSIVMRTDTTAEQFKAYVEGSKESYGSLQKSVVFSLDKKLQSFMKSSLSDTEILTFILMHEVGHVEQGHSYKNLKPNYTKVNKAIKAGLLTAESIKDASGKTNHKWFRDEAINMEIAANHYALEQMQHSASLKANPSTNVATITSLVQSNTVNTVSELIDLIKATSINDNQVNTPEFVQESIQLLSSLYAQVGTAIDPVLVELHDGSVNTGSADTLNRKIEMIRQGSPVNRVTQSQTSILLHEYSHIALTGAIVAGEKSRELVDLWTLAKDSFTYTVFLENVANPTPDEIADAKALYAHIFEQTRMLSGVNVGLLEFASFGLSDPNFSAALKQLYDSRALVTPAAILNLVKAGSVFDRLITAVMGLIGKLLDRTVATRNSPNAHTALVAIAQHIVTVTQQTKAQAQQPGFLNKLDALVEKGNDAVASKADEVFSKIDAHIKAGRAKVNMANPTSTPMPAKAQRAAQFAFYKIAKVSLGYTEAQAVLAAGKITTYEERDAALSFATKSIMLHEDGLLKHLYHQVITDHPLSDTWIKALRQTKAGIEMHRKAIKDTIAESINSQFTSLTEEQDAVLEQLVLKTDLQSLWTYLKHDTQFVLDLMQDRSQLNILVGTLANKIQDPVVLQQADGLAEFMVTSKTSVKDQRLNAEAILTLATQEVDIDVLDAYISAKALQSSTADAKVLLDNKTVFNGVANVLELHKAYVRDSKNTLFDGQTLKMIKGYTSEDMDRQYEYGYFPSSDTAQLKEGGWSRTDHHVTDPVTGTKLSLYTRKNVMDPKVHSGVFSLMSNKRKGTSYSDMLIAAGITDEKIIQSKIKAMRPGSEFIPVPDYKGQIVDYRITMSETDRVKHLGKSYAASRTLGNMFGVMVNKQQTPTHNERMVEVAKKQWDAHKATIPNDFVWVDSTHPEYGKFYASLPLSTKKDIEYTFGRPAIPLPKGVVPLILGHDRWLTGNNALVQYMQSKLPKMAPAYYTNLTTKVVQDFMTLTKNKIVVRMPEVVVTNILSNTAYLLVQGVSTDDIAAGYRDGALELKKFIDTRDEILLLDAKMSNLSGSALMNAQRRKDMLEHVLKTSPIRPMIKEGFFQSIAEDIGDSALAEPLSALKQFLGKHTNVPDFGKYIPGGQAINDQLFMNPNTAMFKLLNTATKYSDFVARYTLYKHEMTKNAAKPIAEQRSIAEITKHVAEAFVQYDLPDPQSLDYMNSIGVLMFTKYFVGIQKVIRRQIKERSLSTAALIAAEYALLDIETILHSSMFVKDLGIMVHIDPTRTIETGLMPSGLQMYYDLYKLLLR